MVYIRTRILLGLLEQLKVVKIHALQNLRNQGTFELFLNSTGSMNLPSMSNMKASQHLF